VSIAPLFLLLTHTYTEQIEKEKESMKRENLKIVSQFKRYCIKGDKARHTKHLASMRAERRIEMITVL
jgi:hypothetical protein